MISHGVEGYPEEVCGVLFNPLERPGQITEVHPVKNVTTEDTARRYLIDPEEFMMAQKHADKEGLDICGIYHTHPDHPPLPSETDLKTAWEGYLYLILSVRNGEFEQAKAWEYSSTEDQFHEVEFQG